MRGYRLFLYIWFVGLAVFFPLDPALAQPAAQETAGDVQTSFSYTPVLQFDTDLDDGGSFDVNRHFVNAEVKLPVDRRLTLGAGFSFDHESWNFDQSNGIAGASPWGDIQRIGLRLPITYAINDDWIASLAATLEAAGESGADLGESLRYGGALFLTHPVSRDLFLGFGFALSNGLEETSLFPFFVIDWQITPNLRLSNPFEAGPVGPAGLELVYAPNADWEMGIGGAYRKYRFRLEDDNAVSGGIGENAFLVTFARVQRRLSDHWDIDLVCGLLADGEISVENSDGDAVADDGYDPASFLAITLKAAF